MIEFIEEAMEEVGFWALFGLSGGGILIGWIASKRMGILAFTWWQMLIGLVMCFGISIFYVNRG